MNRTVLASAATASGTLTEPAPGSGRAAFVQPLDAAAIEREMALAGAPCAVEAVLETGSTNADLALRARACQPESVLLRAAVVQTAGRGRLGRRWYTAPGAALTFSLAFPLADAAPPMAATLACGIAVADVLRAADVPVQLKWPNDVLLDGRKLAGILCELATDDAARRTLAVGVGVNLWIDAAMAASIDQPAAALAERFDLPQLAAAREAWIARLGAALLRALRDFERAGFVPLQPRFMRWMAYADAEVEVLAGGARVASGRALGVDGDGCLLLQTATGLKRMASGELSLRARVVDRGGE